MAQKYRSLLPQNNLKLKNYQEILDYAVDADEIRNIALSGSYGSGKSSVINSYEQIRTDKKFLHITLADFKEQHQSELSAIARAADEPKPSVAEKSADTETDDGVKSTVELLEGKILNQLLQQIDLGDIPLSRFRTKNTTSPTIGKIPAVSCVLFILLLLYTICFDAWQAMVGKLPPGPLDISWSAHPSFRVVVLFVCFAIGGVSIYRLLRTPGLFHLFKKVSIKDVVDVEVFETADDAVFDRYMDEVLYLFERSGADVIVFEDLDRYDVTQIFGKLKEISDLLYQRKKIRDSQLVKERKDREQNADQGNAQSEDSESAQRPVPKFFYLIRDDVFSSTDRTKFFDFIIPVIPVIATGNAYDLMLERFKEVGLQNTFDEHFLRDVSLYLSDLRLVHNIINEYILYQRTLEGNGLKRNPNQQLAMIIYKNLFPQDFEQLQHGQGYMFDILGKREDLLAPKREEIVQEEQELRVRLEQSQAEHLQNIDELNALYFPFEGEVTQIDSKNIGRDLSRTELVKRLIGATKATCVSYNNRATPINLESLRQQMEKNPDYVFRKTALMDKEARETSALNNRLAKLADERRKLGTLTLSELIDKADDNFWMPWNTGCDLTTSRYFPLLKYLITQGYIDEHYTFYISYFYPNSLTVRDMNFRIALNTHQSLGYDYLLDNPSTVLEWIDDSYFSRDELSNFTLFNYLVEQNRTEELYFWLDSIEQRHELDTSIFEFPIALWRQSPHRDVLIQLINKRMPHWFQMWTPLGLISGNEWKQYAIDTLLYSSDQTLGLMNDENWLADAISAHKDFLQIDAPETEKLIEKFKLIGVQFFFVDFREQDIALVRRVYEENLYRLNDRTLTLWLTLYYGAPADTALEKSYTYLLSIPDEPLSCWAQENANAYMTALLHIEDLRFSDDPQAVTAMLNHPNIDYCCKEKYISRLDTHLDMLADIEQKELWPSLLQAERVSFVWENVADYYEAYCVNDGIIDDVLCNFLEKGGGELLWSPSKLNERIGEETTDKLQDSLLKCTELSLNRYRSVWATMGIQYISLSTALADEYISVLIELGVIAVTTKNVTYIRQSYPDFVTDFLLNDSGTAIAELVTKGEVTLTETEMTALLEDGRMTEQIALSLLKTYNGTLSIIGTNYPESIKVEIIDEHFEVHDIGWLLERYDDQDKAIQAAFIRQAKADFKPIHVAGVESKFIPISVYAACLDVMELSQAEELRQFLPDSSFEIVCTSNEAQHFPYTEDVRLILEFFKQIGWIDNYRKQREYYNVTPKQKEIVEV